MTNHMEEWSWPPSYDNGYLPPDSQLHWFPLRETMDPEQRDSLILDRINEVMKYAWERSSFYRKRWSEAGVEPGHLKSIKEFQQVPVVRKEELRVDQARNAPFGSYLCVSPEEVKHIHGTSGTTGRPTAFGISPEDWNCIANAHARVMWAMGIRARDTVVIASPLSLYMGSWGAYIGAERLGARVFPFGAGTPGQSLRTIQWIKQMGATVFYGTPSYALRIAEVAESEGIDPRELGISTMVFSGEPGASIDSMRSLIKDYFGARIFDSGSMAEVSPWMNLGSDADESGVLCWQDLVYTEVCDPVNYLSVPFGGEGTPVYTNLERLSQPMIRLVSNDLTTWEAPSPQALRSYPRLPRGVYGRIDDMFTIRGENIYPSAIDEVLMSDGEYGGEHRIVVSRERQMDVLAVQVEYSPSNSGADPGRWASALADRLRLKLGVATVVEPLALKSLDRAEFKARRVIDNRDLFKRVDERGQSAH